MNTEQIFFAALERKGPEERRAFLDGACVTSPTMRAEIEKLIASHEEAGEFLDGGVFQSEPTIDSSDRTEREGTTIGPYKILQQLGEGGFGVVYMAEQTKPIARKVALKIIKPGMDTREVIARFEAERQALAMMDHPNIARVLDAGSTELGHPYFVMELVKGIPITDYCDKNNLPTAERLELFATVCRAVQHAHLKGIIHRDLKPSNVMVTLHDGEPVPKVIDFGVAKAISQRLTDKTMFTRYGQVIGTPQYMSPEQAEMSGLDIDTRSDVYSLGVLLYELLTGRAPFSDVELRNAGYDEMLKLIREREPAKPSLILQSLDLDTATSVAQQRRCKLDALKRLISGELDWIVLKALSKERKRRYETASSFAEDVERYLAKQPVIAGPPGWTYATRKWITKHRIAITFAAAVTISLMVGLAAAVMGWRKAEDRHKQAVAARDELNAAYEIAEEQAANSRETLDLLIGILTNANESHNASDYTLNQALDDIANQLPNRKDLAPESLGELNRTLAREFLRQGKFDQALAHYQSASNDESANELQRAECLRYVGFITSDYSKLDTAIGLERASDRPDIAARSLSLLGFLKLRSGDFEDSRQLFEESLRLDDSVGEARLLAEVPHVGMAIFQSKSNSISQNESQARLHAVEQAKLLVGDSAEDWLEQSRIWHLGEMPELERFCYDAVRQGDIPSLDLGKSITHHALAWGELGRFDRAFKYIKDAHQFFDEIEDKSRATWRLVVQARWHCQFGNYNEAERHYRLAMKYLETRSHDDPIVTLWVPMELAWLLEREGNPAEAQRLYREAAEGMEVRLRMNERIWGADDIETYMSCALAAFPDQIPTDLAEQYSAYLDKLSAMTQPHPFNFIDYALRTDNLDLAMETSLRLTVDNRHAHFNEHSIELLCTRLREAGRLDDAIAVLESRIAACDKTLHVHHPSRFWPRVRLANLLVDSSNDLPRARRLLNESKSFLIQHDEIAAARLTEVESLLARIDSEE